MSSNYLKLEDKCKEARVLLAKKFGVSVLATPKIVKVIVNAGLGRKLISTEQGKARDELLSQLKDDFKLITGQMPAETKAKKSVASFKSRKGMIIGLKVTLRGKRMYDFLDRVINYVLPRVRDFRGLPLKNIDKNGHLNIGIKETVSFPEVPPTSSKNIFGLQITVVTKARSYDQAKELFYLLGFPIQKGKN